MLPNTQETYLFGRSTLVVRGNFWGMLCIDFFFIVIHDLVDRKFFFLLFYWPGGGGGGGCVKKKYLTRVNACHTVPID